ncbi:MAG: MarR family transcriptional regulator [Mesorhizobium sp.]|uniref:MarR family winged helix-turn-helix transcriptional regulator n=1 Tax=Mesorhizobium sp. TaxID=1871066 RepID=UPI000FE8BE98|nr:MarR family winged helix-turn-helix transcriptional regulator [Mesorhizobium sp.]RWK45357.1 MAG: MarR family transcriptional regulator [Mesorhizobium sp.]RWM13970.1 MAG: MarR family transcriptional regulator [Mesorhizobium sp.]TIQ13100.1 MAG: winged helix-turn-helix transcriptional regulator [Mesorhizobium sp.]
MSNDVLCLEHFLPYRLNRLADAISREFSKIYKDRYGLSRPEWRTLATLGQFGTTTATAIGAHSAMHKTKVSRAVFELEKRKWLVRQADGQDRRVEHLQLTAAGIRAYRDLVPLAKEFEARFLKALSVREKDSVLSALTCLERAAGAQTGYAPAGEAVAVRNS